MLQCCYLERLTGSFYEEESIDGVMLVTTNEIDVVLWNEKLLGYKNISGDVHNSLEIIIRIEDLVYTRLH